MNAILLNNYILLLMKKINKKNEAIIHLYHEKKLKVIWTICEVIMHFFVSKEQKLSKL
ncbi:unnamed protein product [Brugia pahangi]|uniref:Uncharacterized protein n=1 Tax=Brugia pahangi TaxID=6280 RepID=A0A0N4T944_BRUPA|nr:unnamed protein product [Brugia pahangi]